MLSTTVNPAPAVRRVRRAAVCTVAAGCLLAGIGTSTGAVAVDENPLPTQFYVPCTIDQSLLPRTPDAAVAWLATCYEFDQLPGTPDSIVAWLR